MEHCSGLELYHSLNTRKVYSEKEAAQVTHQMLEAIEYLHCRNIAHRDIKLENWLYENDTYEAKLKLIDFGFSTVWRAGVSSMMKASCGSLAYVSPETLAGSYTNACDIWSLGVVVYMLLVGYPPFSGADGAVMNKIRQGDYCMSGKRWKEISPAGRNFVSQLLEIDTNRRLTAKQALAHEWIHMRVNIPELPIDDSVLINLKSFATSTRFKRATLTLMALTLTSQEINGPSHI
eukprot:GHVR01060178.1.p1 GENE.GHVR01060178.1~~GHVR01060178.1.p1  ORF type:complete len:234 (+),score=36.21 GHVR01060178.1:149-850(+)